MCAASSSRCAQRPLVRRPPTTAPKPGTRNDAAHASSLDRIAVERQTTQVRAPIRSMWSGVLRIAAIARRRGDRRARAGARSAARSCRRSRDSRPRSRTRKVSTREPSGSGAPGRLGRSPRYARARSTSSSVSPYDSSCVSPHVTSPWWASTTARAPARSATRFESSKPGRRYGTTATSSPSASCTAASGSGAFASEQIASAWTWSTCAAGRKACSSVSIDGRGASGLDEAAREVGDHLLVAHRVALAQRAAGRRARAPGSPRRRGGEIRAAALDPQHAPLAAEVVELDELRRGVAAAVEDERADRSRSAASARRAARAPSRLADHRIGLDGGAPGAARRLHVDRVARLAAEERRAERRGRRDGARRRRRR